MIKEIGMQLKTSVRNLVEFLMRSGDIDNRRMASPDVAMAEGSRIHRSIQRRMGADYQAEVPLRYVCRAGRYDIVIEGRADGVIAAAEGFTIDEIKGTYRDVTRMTEPEPVHLAQAKCYAFMYGQKEEMAKRGGTGQGGTSLALREYGPTIRVRMTYCNLDREEIRYFHFAYTLRELEQWFLELMGQYRRWADMEFDWRENRQSSIHSLSFPFVYREGQKELAGHVYRTICHKHKLFLEAPTGVGKTISTVFPAVKAIGEGKAERIFYLTAKTITRTVADDTFVILRKKGLAFKTVLLTARDKICFLEEPDCNPKACPYAEGHYDRINEALYDILTKEVNYSRDTIEAYAQTYRVCPFELSLDISLFCDGIICDYNYVFDPHVYLRRFFGENARGEHLFLVDEAHNLVERGREMYSASLVKEEFLALKRKIKEAMAGGRGTKEATYGAICRRLDGCNKELLALKRECETYQVLDGIDSFAGALTKLHGVMSEYLEDHEEADVAGIRRDVLDFYFSISHFLEIYELLDGNYVIYTQMEGDGSFLIRLFCVNPAVNLRACMSRAVSTILFSATLLPIQYYKRLLGGEAQDYEVYAQTAFDGRRCGLFLGGDVTTRYSRRGAQEYRRIACYIREITKNRCGNYMIFFPSHSFLREVYQVYVDTFLDEEAQECIIQEEHMSEQAREDFLNRFSTGVEWDFSSVIKMDIQQEEERSLLGFCVMGGIFSEGIDLKRDSLIGALIVGTGIPQVCPEREILRHYFDGAGGGGFDYAYRYPGMNKVLQAAGRVIRTAEDVGVVVLLDERFESPAYRRLFPREWEDCRRVRLESVGGKVERFWDEWL